jgi:acetolactate synthase-1/2/3 large subunit
MAKSRKDGVGRRGFLKGAAAGAAGAAALVATPELARAEQAQAPRPAVALPSAEAVAAETGPVSTNGPVLTEDRPGSDFMVDVIKSLGFEYIAANPGSSFRSLHESLVNYGGNKSPELLTCCHEESSVFMAVGYAKVEGKPIAVMAHSTVGLQHASMGIYDAFGGQSPVFIILGNTIDAAARRPGVEWNHSAQDAAAMVRDYTKWDDNPISLTHFAESSVRAYKIAMTPPRGPVIIVADSDLQEKGVEDPARLSLPKLTLTRPPAGDSGSVAELAKLLVAAESPVLMGGLAIRTPEGMASLIELAETLQAPVSGGKFPSRHPLNQPGAGVIRNADLIVGFDVADFWGVVHDLRDQQERTTETVIKKGAKLVSITANDLYLKSNYQNFQRYAEVDMAIAADPEATLPSLVEAVKRLVTPERRRIFEERGKTFAAASAQALEQARTAATYAWDASPISTQRLSAELWNVIKDKDWASVGGNVGRLWNVDKHYRTLAGGGVAGVGSSLPTSVGAALAHRKHGRLVVSIQNDGDFMYAPGALWTAAHHRIPLLSVMNNNRAYHQEVMHIQRMANRHQRGIVNAGIGTKIEDPNIDYAGMARAMGVHSEGPITNPNDLGPALKRAVDIVMKGEPALVDVVTQPR